MPVINIASFYLFNGFIDLEINNAFSGLFPQSNTEFVYKMIYILTLFFIQHKRIERTELVEKKYWLYLYVFIAICMITLIIFMTFTVQLNNDKYSMIISFFAGTTTTLFYLFDKFFLSFYNNLLENHQLFIEKEKLKIEFNDSISNQKRLEEVREFRHDIKNNFIIIKYMIQEKKYKEALNYLNEYTGRFDDFNKFIQTDNLIVSAIVNEKIKKFHTIVFDVVCMIPENIAIDDLDFSIILGNLVDNACEYMDRVNIYKTLNIKIISHFDSDLFIEIKNPCLENQVTNEMLISKKKHKEYHGFGLINIQKAIDKYNGQLLTKIEDDIFIAQVLVPGGGKAE